MASLLRHVQRSVRSLLKRPGATTLMVATLAVAIGANLALFAYLSALEWPGFEAPEPHRVLRLENSSQNQAAQGISLPDWQDLRREATSFSSLVASRVFTTSLTIGDEAYFTWAWLVSDGYFELFGARARLGRLLGDADYRPGAPPAVVISDRFWRERFGSDSEIVGRSVLLNGTFPVTVVGVLPPGFQANGLPQAMYLPLEFWREVAAMNRLDQRDSEILVSLVRLAPGVEREAAQAELDVLTANLERDHPRREARRFRLMRTDELYEGDPYTVNARIMMATVGLFLLLAAANVANLLVARALGKRKEWAIEAALGAPRRELARRLAVEVALVTAAAAVFGTLLGYAAVELLEPTLHSMPAGFGNWADDARFLTFGADTVAVAVGLSLLLAFLCAAAPLAELWRRDLTAPLKTDALGASPGRFGIRRGLVVAQVGLCVLLLLGASLLVQSLGKIYAVDPGFPMEDLHLASFYAPAPAASGGDDRRPELFLAISARLASLPGIEAAGLVVRPPLFGGSYSEAITFEDATEPVDALTNMVDGGYFQALGLPLLAGRGCTSQDRGSGTGAVVVTPAFAAVHWPGREPLGQRLTLAASDPREPATYTVVGVVADHRATGLKDPLTPLSFFCFGERPKNRASVVLRSTLPTVALDRQVRKALAEEDPALALIELEPFDEQVESALAEEHFHARVAAAVGLLGLALAAIGLASVMAYTTAARQREIGIRMALGAKKEQAVGLILTEAGWLLGLGLGLGLLAALGFAPLIASMVFGIGAYDPVTFATVPVLLGLIALLAAYLPARRAAAVEPVEVLRGE